MPDVSTGQNPEAVVLYDESGALLGTITNPLVTTHAGGSGSSSTVTIADGHATGVLKAANPTSVSAQDNTPGNTRSVVILQIPDGHSSTSVELSSFSPTSQVVFEQSETGVDGTWAATNMRRNSTPDVNESYSQIENNPFGTNNVQLWKGTCGGIKFFRIRCNALAAADQANGISVTMESSAGVGGTFLLGNPPSVSDYFTSGTLVAPGDTVEVKAGGMGSFAALFLGNFTGTVRVEQTIDGTNYRPTNTIQTGGMLQSYITGLGTANQAVGARGTASGCKAIRLRADNDFVGSVTGTLRCGAGSIAGFLTAPVQIAGLAVGSATARQTAGSGGTATRIDPSALTGRVTVEIRAMSTNNGSVFVGFTSGVTVATGREILPGEAWTLDVTTATQLWAVAGAAGYQVQVTELA